MFSAFGRDFYHIDDHHKSELESLEFDGTITSQQFVEDLDDFALVRFRLTPSEIIRYVDAMQAYDEWIQGVKDGLDDDSALSRIANRQVRIEAATYRLRKDLGLPPAAFLGEGLEDLLCFEDGNRREVLGSGYERDRRRLVDEVIQGIPAVVDHLSRPGVQGLSGQQLTKEEQIRDLLYIMLRGVFPDVTIEDSVSKFAGSGKRVDLSIAGVSTVIEVKFARRENASRIIPELHVDIGTYHRHSSCDTLQCVIWDPNRVVQDRSAVERDLSGARTIDGRKFVVRVHFVP
ncbi:PD-(D/E)XK nuclease domain-containing protein [Pseudonocardia phyllosphaerae]|uniref:PD-(D/E)XK nuclease domain-containing protein n=1 Tax=Pseudonocardia phyllosphaerae TaxID=3390502 RepID=UPI0039795E0E